MGQRSVGTWGWAVKVSVLGINQVGSCWLRAGVVASGVVMFPRQDALPSGSFARVTEISWKEEFNQLESTD